MTLTSDLHDQAAAVVQTLFAKAPTPGEVVTALEDIGWRPPCPAIGPSDRQCIGRAEWHEIHADRVGTTWRDYSGKHPGVEARKR